VKKLINKIIDIAEQGLSVRLEQNADVLSIKIAESQYTANFDLSQLSLLDSSTIESMLVAGLCLSEGQIVKEKKTDGRQGTIIDGHCTDRD
jgi:hypothetical protein